jgi:uncharacterized metal-binding protein YceD (DUF177 family)
MNINLDSLGVNKEIRIDLDVNKDDNLDKRILDLKDSKVLGRIYLNSLNDIVLECTFSGTMYIEDAITLESVPYPFSIDIEENIEELQENYEDCYDNSQNTLDLISILWQNIVLEVPISYTLDKYANLKGDGWELVREDKKTKEIDPRLKKLEELLER